MQAKSKAIIEYILRVLFFLSLIGQIQNKIFSFYLVLNSFILNFLYKILPITEVNEKINIFLGLIAILTFFIFCYGFSTYFFAKIFGIFKKLDKLKNWQSFLIILFISNICLNIYYYLDNNNLFNMDIKIGYSSVGWSLIPAFLLYKYFQFLTKKYPIPFEKIGYYCSIEFYKGLFKRITSKDAKKV